MFIPYFLPMAPAFSVADDVAVERLGLFRGPKFFLVQLLADLGGRPSLIM